MGARKRVTKSPVSACEALGLLLLQPLRLGLGETLLPCWPILLIRTGPWSKMAPTLGVCTCGNRTWFSAQPGRVLGPCIPTGTQQLRLQALQAARCIGASWTVSFGMYPTVSSDHPELTWVPQISLGMDQPGGEPKEVGRVLKKRPFIK